MASTSLSSVRLCVRVRGARPRRERTSYYKRRVHAYPCDIPDMSFPNCTAAKDRIAAVYKAYRYGAHLIDRMRKGSERQSSLGIVYVEA